LQGNEGEEVDEKGMMTVATIHCGRIRRTDERGRRKRKHPSHPGNGSKVTCTRAASAVASSRHRAASAWVLSASRPAAAARLTLD